MKSFFLIIVFVGTAVALCAQPRPAKGRSEVEPTKGITPREPSGVTRTGLVDRSFFPPELIMQNQSAIGLSKDQQASIRAETEKTMAQFAELQRQETAEGDALVALAGGERPDERQVLEQLEKLLGVENQIKRLHTGLLVRLKNILTPSQQARLREIANAAPRPRVSTGKQNR
jgi:Spy/CpxP family protein refolding chaperone